MNAGLSTRQLAHAIRLLAIDAIEQSQSGHPGLPLGMADVAAVLWTEFLRFDPQNPQWADRDRFVLSAGHGSMLLYALLYLTGFPGMTLDQLKAFRQFGSLTPGHPEYGHTPGVEMTTGPLAQGLGHGVGMALAEALLAQEFGPEVVRHWTYVLVSDGCLMEGLSQEAISLAGHLGLGRLIVLFDDNGITIDGPTTLATSENHVQRFAAAGWHVQSIDGHHIEEIREALQAALACEDRPSLIACKTQIGWGAPTKAGTASAHGSPLGGPEAEAARLNLGFGPVQPFAVPEEVIQAWRALGARGAAAHQAWQERLYQMPAPQREAFTARLGRQFPESWRADFWEALGPALNTGAVLATRQWSQKALDALGTLIPGLLGGSADLTPSNNTQGVRMTPVAPHRFEGNYVHFGVREHGMAAALGGLALHGGFVPYGGTFLCFSDYARPAIRLAALMGIPVIYVMTHDSIGLGEDGPTHQPIEHLLSLRAIPGLHVFRPADGVEVAECWEAALGASGPSLLALSRQGVARVRTSEVPSSSPNLSARGAYLLRPSEASHRVDILATGSEVGLAVQVRELLEAHHIGTRVISMPCWELFDAQDPTYRASLLPPHSGVLRVSLEAGSTLGWQKYVGDGGLSLGIDTYGASAPAKDLWDDRGLTPAKIVQRIQEHLAC